MQDRFIFAPLECLQNILFFLRHATASLQHLQRCIRMRSVTLRTKEGRYSLNTLYDHVP